uniref:Putative zinc finger BED domain-containing protein RICESLEEPER 2-like isoform X2 n=1 Tax=Davidia involucrata TaxID=16924 RepID=A0A5B6ZS64_DAVIN
MSTELSQANCDDEYLVDEDIDMTEVTSQSEVKRRKLTSKVWDGFTKIRSNASEVQDFKFDPEKSRMDFARMIIKHNYPFNMAEHEYFEIFCNGLQPFFKLVSQNTLRADVLKVYQEEKDKLYNLLDELSCRITLAIDICTSDHQNFAYTCLTAHYINDDWELKKKILAYKYIEYPHDGETLFNLITDLMLEWNIDRKLFSIVVDNATSNDVMVRLLKTWLCDKSLLYLDGDLFHVRCSAHILSLIVQDGLKVIEGFLNKIRESVRYLNRSPYGKQKFNIAINQVRVRGKKKVPMDVPNRWNSTFLMLETALSLKEAFCRLEKIDRNYEQNPSEEEWQVAQVIKGGLEIFFNATSQFSGTNFPTSNVFFFDICDIQVQLREWEISEHECLRLMAGPMKEKFEKYWEGCGLVLAIAVVLDPRFKMDLVEYYYVKIYGSDAGRYVQRVRNAFFDLYNEYRGDLSISKNSNDGVVADGSSSSLFLNAAKDDKFSGFDKWYMERYSITRASKKSEVEQYLEEPLLPRKKKFNILHWWKVNSAVLPILARMARDVLAVLATTIASEAAFNVGGRVVDASYTSLLPEVVEALVTTNDWIESRNKKSVESNVEDITK